MDIGYKELSLGVNYIELRRLYSLFRRCVYNSIENHWKYYKLDTFKNNEEALPFLKKIAPFVDEDFSRDMALFIKLWEEARKRAG